MREVRIGDICDVTSSKRIYASEYQDEGIPFYRSKEIIEKNNGLDISEQIFISNDRYERIKNKFGVPVEGDILLTSVGTLGIPYLVKKDEKFYFKDGNLTWLKNFSDDVDSEYLYYWLSSDFGKSPLVARAIGSSQGAITIDILKKYKVLLPSKEKQKEIVKILKSIDDVINNNIRQTNLLEKTIEDIYKEWFVRFRFPNYECSEMENGIPNDWSIKRIKDFGTVVTGKTPSTSNSDYYGDDYLFIKTPDMHNNYFVLDTEEKLSLEGSNSQKKCKLPINSIMVSCIGTAGIVAINKKEAHTNQQINSIMLNNNKQLNWLFFTIKSMKETINMFGSTGATMTNLSKGKFEKLKLLKPTDDLIERFDSISAPIMEKIYCLQNEIGILVQQKNMLLPRLMSEKLEV